MLSKNNDGRKIGVFCMKYAFAWKMQRNEEVFGMTEELGGKSAFSA